MGLTANGKFVDFYTGKETQLEDIIKESGQLKYMGQLDNDNQFGPGMNYFQGADGKFYVSPGNLNNQKENFMNWNIKQADNKFSKEYEFPLSFNDRRNIRPDGTIPEGIPSGKVTKNLKDGSTQIELNLGKDKIKVDNKNIPDEVMKEMNKSMSHETISKLKPEDILKINTAYSLHKLGLSDTEILNLGF